MCMACRLLEKRGLLQAAHPKISETKKCLHPLQVATMVPPALRVRLGSGEVDAG